MILQNIISDVLNKNEPQTVEEPEKSFIIKPQKFKRYIITDTNTNQQFTVRNMNEHGKHALYLYSDDNFKLGKVVQNESTYRVKAERRSIDTHPRDFEVYMGEEKIDLIKSTSSKPTRNFQVKHKNWTIKSDKKHTLYTIYNDDKKVVGTVADTYPYSPDQYGIAVQDERDWFIMIAIALAIEMD